MSNWINKLQETVAKSTRGKAALASRDSGAQVVAISSGKGGVGKSFLTVNLALLLCAQNYRVLLFDADLMLGSADLMLGLQPKYSVLDAIQNRVSIEECIIKGPGNMDVLPASDRKQELIALEENSIRSAGQQLNKLSRNYDIILIDTGAGITDNVMFFVMGADKVLLVVTPDPASIADGYAMTKLIKSGAINKPVALVANMVKSYDEGEALHRKMNLMVHKFLRSEIGFGGALTREEAIANSVRFRVPFVLQSAGSPVIADLQTIAKNMLNLDRDLTQPNLFTHDGLRVHQSRSTGALG